MANIKVEKNAQVDGSPVARFLTEKIQAISHKKNQKQIAAEAGYDKANVLSMMKRGDANVPLEKVPLLAKALEVDPGHLLRLSLEQFWPNMGIIIQEIFGNVVSHNEMELVREVRHASREFDPELSDNQRKMIAKIAGARVITDAQVNEITKILAHHTA